MNAYREASAASPDLVGAARVKFPTAAKSYSTPISAMHAQVGFETVPAERGSADPRSNEDRELPELTKTGTNKSRLWCAHSTRGLETGQPPETVKGEYHRQRDVAVRLGDLAVDAEKSRPTCAPDFLEVTG